MVVVPLTQAITWFFGWLGSILGWLNSQVAFNLFGYNVSYLSFVFGCLLLTMVVSILFKGAKG